ncbi:MAG: alpha amylase C-terminal domain-containing protein [Planctomycetes bacterium]|nr:alpha amylase C-terminal domain-containing protein [Planctomycetota bacterium]
MPAEPDGTGLIKVDPWLEPYADALRHRYRKYREALARCIEAAGSLDAFARGYEYYGFNRGECDGRPGVWYREWAPAADALFLVGDFNGWDRRSHPMQRDPYGVWSIFLPDEEYATRLLHGSRIKVHVHSRIGPKDRIPAYIKRVVYEPETNSFCSLYWQPPVPYIWQLSAPRIEGGLRIYESHVGMALEEPRVGTYREFAQQILPRIAAAGYNAVQLMAVQEHPYYASFGYHVSSFFAASSRFGEPEDLKALIDEAHRRGLVVLLDLVHSHAIKNVLDGLNHFDGTDYQYFHAGGRGEHPAWDSLLFDYGKIEVLRFLLSNVRFWLDEYRFDGFRFDGVTSMMYLHHGNKAFTCYDDYLRWDIDEAAVSYLQLANQVAHEFNPACITIAEDVSGMVGLARPLDEGGLGFDYRLAMGLPDYWIKLLKHVKDEDWPMQEMLGVMTNRRAHEKHVAYAESHDQALVGDKTVAFWLMDADMYWHMSREHQSLIIDRGIALHKMIRLITFSLGGEAYLNFIGNEFGHPEWVDFPREGNNLSYHYARRQWSLVDNPKLRYRDLATFDREMLALDQDYNLLNDTLIQPIHIFDDQKLMVYRRGPLVFVFNWHPTQSYRDYRIGVPDPTDYRLILNTDDPWFGGHALVCTNQVYPWQAEPLHGREQSIQLYIPARTAQVLAPL